MIEHAPSYYAATAHPHALRPALAGDVAVDVCVVGGGFTGLSAALTLAEAGRSVRLIDAKRIGWGASGRNGGQLHTGQRRDQTTLEAWFGVEMAHRLWDLAEAAKHHVKDLIARHAIACDWRDGLIIADHKPRYVAAERAYVEKLQRDYGYSLVRFLERDALAAAIGTGAYHGGFHDAGAGHLHPLNFALGLARAAEAAGAVLHDATPALRVVPGARPVVETAHGRITADAVILAGNGYLEGLDAELEARVMPINNYILTTEPLGARMTALIPGGEAVADSRFVVYYWRPTVDSRLLFGGGETYSRRFPADLKSFVRRHMLNIYPDLADVRIDHAWGGTLAVTVKRLPFIRRLRSGVYAGSGYSGQGVATATFAGHVLARAIEGDTDRLDTFAALPTPAFPGGKLLRAPSLALAMTWFALRDRL